MNKVYIDRFGATQNIEVDIHISSNGPVYMIRKNGVSYLDLIREDNSWEELFIGATPESVEYGKLVEQIFTINKQPELVTL